MIVYNCEEYDLVQNVFVPFFENRGLSVFMEDRDMTPGRSRTSAISEAVQSSRTFVIVGTESFLRDQWNTEFVLRDLILQIIHEHQGHHVIVIKWNNVAVPPPLSWDQKVTIVDWSDRRLLGDNLTILRNRIRSVPYIGRMF
jgi:UDP-glucose 6-dehydrogenase